MSDSTLWPNLPKIIFSFCLRAKNKLKSGNVSLKILSELKIRSFKNENI